MVTADKQKHDLDDMVRAMGIWYRATHDKDPELVFDAIRVWIDLKAEMQALPTKGIGRAIEGHYDLLSAMAIDVCKYLDDVMLDYETDPNKTLEFTERIYKKVREGLNLFRQASFHKNGYLKDSEFDFGLYVAFEEILKEELQMKRAGILPQQRIEPPYANEHPDNNSMDGYVQMESSEVEILGDAVALPLKAKYRNEPPRRKTTTQADLPKIKPDPVLEGRVVAAWRAKGQNVPRLAEHAREATTRYLQTRQGQMIDDTAVLIIMDGMSAQYGYPSAFGR